MYRKVLVFSIIASFLGISIISGPAVAEDSQLVGNKGFITSAEAKETAETTDEAVLEVLEEPTVIQGVGQEEIGELIISQDGSKEDTELKYTLGTDDIIQIDVRRHPEFSGAYTINSEGKIQYKFVGDISAEGYTRHEFKDKLTKILSQYIVEPDIEVTIMEYRSKVYYVVGEVGRPGKYYMRADSIPVREAVVTAGLPTLSSAMRRTKLITPDEKGRVKKKNIDLYKLVYQGDLRQNLDMKPGDVLHVPATLFAKIMRIINPIAAPVGPAETIQRTATGGLSP